MAGDLQVPYSWDVMTIALSRIEQGVWMSPMHNSTSPKLIPDILTADRCC